MELSAESDSSVDSGRPADLTKSNADSWPDALLHLLYLWFLSFFFNCGAVHPAGRIYHKQNLWQCAWVTTGKYSDAKVVKPSVVNTERWMRVFTDIQLFFVICTVYLY